MECAKLHLFATKFIQLISKVAFSRFMLVESEAEGEALDVKAEAVNGIAASISLVRPSMLSKVKTTHCDVLTHFAVGHSITLTASIG